MSIKQELENKCEELSLLLINNNTEHNNKIKILNDE